MDDLTNLESAGQESQEPEGSSQGASQAPDLSTIRVSVGDGPDAEMTLPDLVKSYKESRRAMSLEKQEKAELLKQFQWARDFAKDLQTKPGLRQHLEAYYAGQVEDQGGYPRGAAPTPESLEMAELKTKVASVLLNSSMDALSRELKDDFGLDLAPEQRASLWEDVARTGSEDVKTLYWARFGKDLVKQASTKATKQTAAKIADNASAYRGPSVVSGAVSSGDAPAMFSDEWNQQVLSALEKAQKKG